VDLQGIQAAFEKKGYTFRYFETGAQAAAYLDGAIDGRTVGFGDSQTLNALGGDVEETEDGLIIRGKPQLSGGTVDAQGDHRIAMLAAVASVVCTGPVTITGAEAIRKSYPTFWQELRDLGKEVAEEP